MKKKIKQMLPTIHQLSHLYLTILVASAASKIGPSPEKVS